MIFINPDFFEHEPVKIANVFDNGDVQKDVARFIGTYEKQCLLLIFGACLYKEIQDSYEWDAATKKFKAKETMTPAIKRLVDGHDYDAPESSAYPADFMWYYAAGCGCGCGESNCQKRSWKGLIQTDEFVIGDTRGSTKKSFITDYIYYHYLLANRSVTAGTGQQVLAGENSTTVQNFSKRIDRWNEFVFSVVGGRNGETSLFRFMQENKADYPTWTGGCRINFKDKW